jgi:hypothetical protein
VLLRLAYLGVANVFALLRLLPMSSQDKDAEILDRRADGVNPVAARRPPAGACPGLLAAANIGSPRQAT